MSKNYNIKFRFEDKENSLSKDDGLRLSELKGIVNVIDELDGNDYKSGFVLSEISGNCYQLQLSTVNEVNYDTLLKVAHNSANKNESELSDIEKKFRKAINKPLNKNNRTLTVINNKGQELFTTPHIEINKVFETYSTKKTVTGLITKIGDFDMSKSSIQIDGYKHQIRVNDAQDSVLKDHYRNSSIRAIVTQNVNITTGKVTSCELESFTIIKKGNLIENLKGLSKDFLSNFKFDSNDDILKALND